MITRPLGVARVSWCAQLLCAPRRRCDMAGRTVADRLAQALGAVLGRTGLPVRLRGWDGSIPGPECAPVVAVHSRRALRRMLWSPGQLGIGRAYVADEIDMEDDVFPTFIALRSDSGPLVKETPATATP